jgi:hypothetical protein
LLQDEDSLQNEDFPQDDDSSQDDDVSYEFEIFFVYFLNIYIQYDFKIIFVGM